MDSFPPPFVPGPASGRVYRTRRIVRSGDVTPAGRLRLDALARYLQAAAEDDLVDSGLAEPVWWVLRRCELAISSLPVLGDRLSVATYCSGTGPRWAERTTTLSAADGEAVQARAVWAVVGRANGRPAPLSADFLRTYAESAAGRTVSARLSHLRPGSAADRRAWPLRAADFDVAGHVNNAVHWAAVEDELAVSGWVPAIAEMEYHRAITPGYAPTLVTDRRDREAAIWLVDGGVLLASARLER
ncbi:MAG: acyl-ACP thioesterase domain-containing protein [Streptosporangiaceae bacterium]